MTEALRKLLADRAKLINDQRVLLDKAGRENRGFNSEEKVKYENLGDEVDRLENVIAKEKLGDQRSILEDRESSLSRSFRGDHDIRSMIYGSEVVHSGPRFSAMDAEDFRDARYANDESRKAFRDYLRYGPQAMGASEFRALQADSDTAGGFLVLPLTMSNQIIKKLDDEVFVRKLATVLSSPKSESLGAPALDNDPGDPTWTAEIATGTEDSTMSLARRDLTPNPIARRILVSNKLIRAAWIDAESLVINRLVYKFGIVQEKAFLTGTGSNQPMGVFTAATAGFGISTARDVSIGNTDTGITTDGLLEAFYSLKAQYRKKATWVLHRDVVKMIRKLKDGDGNYIWQLGITWNKPDTILGAPYNESEYAPNTFTTKKYVGIVGDFSFYWIVDALNMLIQRLIELYAATNQVGFIGRCELDAMPVIEEAFSRIQLS